MKLLKDWQYKYIEKSLYEYYTFVDKLNKGVLVDTELKLLQAIEEALLFFKDTSHEKMLTHFYFNAASYREEMTKGQHYNYVLDNYVHTEYPNGFVIRREIVYRIAMNCYRLGVFSS